MDEPVSRDDALRHIRFAGRAKDPSARCAHRAQAHPDRARPAALRTSEPADPFLAWVLHRAGLAAESYRGRPLQRRLAACLRALHANTEAQARQRLTQRPDLLPSAISALLIGVTDFFRDQPVFDALRRQVLPELARPARPLRIWSAGCSSGAELYSVAILLDQAGLLAKSHLLGTDCREDAITDARECLYSSHELRGMEPSPRRRHFEPVGALWRPIEPLRRRVHWKVADLNRGVEDGPWDMILWRNMAIYLTAEAAGPIWRGLVSALAHGGVLVVGKAERPPVELPLTCMARCIYRAAPAAAETTTQRIRRDPRVSRASEKLV